MRTALYNFNSVFKRICFYDNLVADVGPSVRVLSAGPWINIITAISVHVKHHSKWYMKVASHYVSHRASEANTGSCQI